MKLPKLRFTFGNIVGAVTGVAGLIVNNSSAVAALSPVSGNKLIAGAALILGATKGLLSFNHDNIPAENTIQAGPIVVERTGPLKSDTPSSN